MTSSHPSQALGRNVHAKRTLEGWTLETLAQRLGWSIEMVTALEAGNLDATLDQIDQLAACLGLEPHNLLAATQLADQQRRFG